MTPEARDYLEKAREDLDDAAKIAKAGIAKVAARCAYYAAFHAAEAFIFENTGRVGKTHSGVRAEFARLAKATPQVDRAFPKFLAKADIDALNSARHHHSKSSRHSESCPRVLVLFFFYMISPSSNR